MEYRIDSQSGSTVTIGLRGDMLGDDAPDRLRAFVEEHFVADGVALIALDMSAVEMIDLEGVAVLASLARSARRRGKRLVVLGPQPRVEEKLRQTGMLDYLTADIGARDPRQPGDDRTVPSPHVTPTER